MAYLPNIPGANDLISQSQSQIQGNFVAIGTLLNPDNNVIKFPVAGADPGTIATTLQLYSKNGTNGKPQLFLEREMGSTDLPTIINCTESLKAANGWTALPSGIVIQWGQATQNGTTANSTFNFPVAFANAALTIVGTPIAPPAGSNDDALITLQVVSTTTGQVQRKTHFGTTVTFNYIVIGY